MPDKASPENGPAERLTAQIRFSVTPAHRARLLAEAQAQGVRLSTWIREQLPASSAGSAAKPRAAKRPATSPELVRQVARIGNNLNQLARAGNRGFSSADFWPVMRELGAIRDALAALAPSRGSAVRDADLTGAGPDMRRAADAAAAASARLAGGGQSEQEGG